MLVGLSSSSSSSPSVKSVGHQPLFFLSTGWNQSSAWLDPTDVAVNVVDNALVSCGSSRETWRTTKRALPPFSQSIREKRRKTLLWTENDDKLRRWDGSTERESLLLSSIKRRRSSTVGGILLSCIVLLPLFFILLFQVWRRRRRRSRFASLAYIPVRGKYVTNQKNNYQKERERESSWMHLSDFCFFKEPNKKHQGRSSNRMMITINHGEMEMEKSDHWYCLSFFLFQSILEALDGWRGGGQSMGAFVVLRWA